MLGSIKIITFNTLVITLHNALISVPIICHSSINSAACQLNYFTTDHFTLILTSESFFYMSLR